MPATTLAQPMRTRHNLALAPADGLRTGTGTEICIFCHTPQGSDTTAAVPMWNRGVPSPFSFTTYDSLGTSSLEGRMAPVGSVSVACLSCHDGVTGMSAAVRMPGADANAALPRPPALLVQGDVLDRRLVLQPGIGGIGVDLVDDHPVGLQYGGGGLRAGAPADSPRDPDFRPASTAVINSTRVWWIDTEAHPNGTRQRTDMILYTRAPGAGYPGQAEPEPFVECASCHDPHSSARKFLRVANHESGVCMACHMK